MIEYSSDSSLTMFWATVNDTETHSKLIDRFIWSFVVLIKYRLYNEWLYECVLPWWRSDFMQYVNFHMDLNVHVMLSKISETELVFWHWICSILQEKSHSMSKKGHPGERENWSEYLIYPMYRLKAMCEHEIHWEKWLNEISKARNERIHWEYWLQWYSWNILGLNHWSHWMDLFPSLLASS